MSRVYLGALMPLKLCVLASGSSGNCTFVASPTTGILIDAGLSCRETERRLGLIGVDVAAVRAVCVTHEHEDHHTGLRVLHRRYGIGLYANAATVGAIEEDPKAKGLPWNIFSTGSPFDVGDLRIEPFSVPHDSYDPVGFVVNCGSARMGIVTDMGMVTGLIRERLKRCHAVVVEANHDERLLRDADRPWSLKQRIAGRQGHLSNDQAAELIGEIAGPELHVVFLAHLSADCNRPELAVKTVRKVLERRNLGPVDVRLTYPDRPCEPAITPDWPG